MRFACLAYLSDDLQNKMLAAMQDLIVLIPHWILMIAMVAGYCVLIFMMEVPGCPK